MIYDKCLYYFKMTDIYKKSKQLVVSLVKL